MLNRLNRMINKNSIEANVINLPRNPESIEIIGDKIYIKAGKIEIHAKTGIGQNGFPILDVYMGNNYHDEPEENRLYKTINSIETPKHVIWGENGKDEYNENVLEPSWFINFK